ncbi:xylose isomerase [Segetibacter sp. 3557_3]|uniref:xylose isomerase n=1 Tax=Segetibacter sp. 3557_3 TaxID=2547429 RepID=UPI001058B1E2|nr:xylose isomerase [Segetibacter sp. 3557_3]TDH23478.1 xylose isomerase [Segetibacter sp. 3557_3]
MKVEAPKTYFQDIPDIKYEGLESDNPLAFRWYDENKVVAGKTLRDHFKFACAYWHSFNDTGADPFGESTHQFPWNEYKFSIDRARAKADAAFEFITKLHLPYYCFHDMDVVDYTSDVADNDKRLQTLTSHLKQKQQDTGAKLLWGTANLFSNKRYMNGAATNPDFLVLAHGAAQVKAALDATIELGGENYVFWGGREGYMSLLNTNMKREKEHLARFLHTAKDYARRNGFKGTFFIEPKPAEPSKHQYDYDVETVVGFLRQYDLIGDFKINIEVNHATLAGHTFTHELQAAADHGVLGSIDANRGDYQNGWDTDQFPNNINEITEAMLIFLEAGGLQGGGVNFDAKIRRNSTDPQDLFYAHIGAMDTFARALIIADEILQNSEYKKFRQERYASFNSGKGKQFEEGILKLEDLRQYAIDNGEPEVRSGRQEWLENLINRYI